jgi:hypothetical protein
LCDSTGPYSKARLSLKSLAGNTPASKHGLNGYRNLPSRADFGEQIWLGDFGTNFGSDVTTACLQMSKSERKPSCFWQTKRT